MSVLKANRTESSSGYVYHATQIYGAVVNFLRLLPPRSSNVMTPGIMHLADQLVDAVVAAESANIREEYGVVTRRENIEVARNAVKTLDIKLRYCYDAMMLNPQGCFTNAKGDTLPPAKAKQKLDSMANEIGNLIDEEMKALTGVLRSVKKIEPKIGK